MSMIPTKYILRLERENDRMKKEYCDAMEEIMRLQIELANEKRYNMRVAEELNGCCPVCGNKYQGGIE